MAKRYGRLWEKICDMDNIRLAWKCTRKGKKRYTEVQNIDAHPDYYLEQIREMLIKETYQFSQARMKTIYEPKKRIIYVVPVFPDRILHHCIMNIVAPIWESTFYEYSFACRKGKGFHAASKYAASCMRKTDYYLKGDIKKYYPSIHHETLKKIIREKIKCESTLRFFDRLIDSVDGDRNIPIGHYTSQWLGNLNLNKLDCFVKHELKYNYYLRYMDDFIIFDNDKNRLRQSLKRIREFLDKELHLTLSKEGVYPNRCGLNAFGYRHIKRVDNGQIYILLRPSSSKRIRKRIGKDIAYFNKGRLSVIKFYRKIAANNGILAHAKTRGFRSKFLFDTLFYLARTSIGGEEELQKLGDIINLSIRQHLEGQLTKMAELINRNILLTDVVFTKNKYVDQNSNGVEELVIFQFAFVDGLSEKTMEIGATPRVAMTASNDIYLRMKELKEHGIPVEGVLMRISQKGKAWVCGNPFFENDIKEKAQCTELVAKE
jgi:retron-type reverse transcriptase